MRFKARADRRRHRRAHMVCVVNVQIDYAPDGSGQNANRICRVGLQERAAARGGCPARLRRALIAQLDRRAKLTLSGAEMA